jgi:hypothetical protein
MGRPSDTCWPWGSHVAGLWAPPWSIGVATVGLSSGAGSPRLMPFANSSRSRGSPLRACGNRGWVRAPESDVHGIGRCREGETGARQFGAICGHVQADAAEASPDAAGHFALPLLGAVTGSAVACLEAFVLQAGPPSFVTVPCRSANTVLACDGGMRTLSRFAVVCPSVDDCLRGPQAQASVAGAAQRPLRPLPGQSHKRARRRDPNTARWLMQALVSLHLLRLCRAAPLVLACRRKTLNARLLCLAEDLPSVSLRGCVRRQ